MSTITESCASAWTTPAEAADRPRQARRFSDARQNGRATPGRACIAGRSPRDGLGRRILSSLIREHFRIAGMIDGQRLVAMGESGRIIGVLAIDAGRVALNLEEH